MLLKATGIIFGLRCFFCVFLYSKLFGKFEISQTQLSSKPYVYLYIRATLFCSMYDKHKQLYLLNKPLLKNTLRNLKKEIGEIDEVEGIERIYEYGFLPY